MPIPVRDAKVLWGRSGSRCAFTDCRKELTTGPDGITIGEMAHIAATSSNGPRADLNMSQTERDSHKNLILLCPEHHTLIDKDENTWTVQRLISMKKSHEEWVQSQLSKGFIWRSGLRTIHYLNVPRILFDLAARGVVLEIPNIHIDEETGLRGLGLEIASLILTFQEIFEDWKPEALDLLQESNLRADNVGARVKFVTRFRTKNVPIPGRRFILKGTLDKDPHLYCRVGDRKIYFPLDPRWITTVTAFTDFRPRRGVTSFFSGLGVLKFVDESIAVVSPLVLGLA